MTYKHKACGQLFDTQEALQRHIDGCPQTVKYE